MISKATKSGQMRRGVVGHELKAGKLVGFIHLVHQD